jgi:hypothetical protein
MNCLFEFLHYFLEGLLCCWELMMESYLERKKGHQPAKCCLQTFFGWFQGQQCITPGWYQRSLPEAQEGDCHNAHILYASTFDQHVEDIKGINTALAHGTTYAIFVLQQAPSRRRRKGTKEAAGIIKYF